MEETAFAPSTATEQPAPPPVETPVETTAAPEDTGAPETVAETDEQKAERLVKQRQIKEQRARARIQQRFDEITQQNREKDALIRRLVEERQPAQREQPKPDEPPKKEQFEGDYDGYIEAKAAYRARQAAREELQQALQQAAQHQQTSVAQQQQIAQEAAHAKAVAEYEAKNPGFRERVLENDEVMVPNEVVPLIRAVPDLAPAIYDAFGKNPALVDHVAKFSGNPLAQLMVLGQIAASASTAPQISNAPPAGKPVGSKPASGSEPPTDPGAYQAWRKKQGMR